MLYFLPFFSKIRIIFLFSSFFGVPNRHHLKNIFNHESLVLVICLAGCKRCDPLTVVIFCAAAAKNLASRFARMRVLFQMRPQAGTEPHTSLMCGSVLRWCVDGGRAAQWRCWGYLYAPRVVSLRHIRSIIALTVYRPHQQTVVDGLKHDDEQ